VFGVLCIAFFALRLCWGDYLDSRYYCMDAYLGHSADAILTGTLDYVEPKTKISYYYLKNVSVRLGAETKQFHFSDFLVIVKNLTNDSFLLKTKVDALPATDEKTSVSLSSGNLVRVSGVVNSFSSPSNPGQFDEKAFYKEKNIFYQMTASSVTVLGTKTNGMKQSLYNLRDSLKKVYETCMHPKEAGIVSAMILGDKTLLDADMKSLYQVNGIGHILAISGLHITIFCTLCYKLFFILRFPRPIPFLAAFFLLAAYGTMTGFGISTSRAVIMMLLGLFAVEIGRSYEPLTAMAISAVFILLQKPYAFLSCSFLLSYSAVLGVFLTYPALRSILPNSLLQERGRRRKMQASIFRKCLFLCLEKLGSSLLLSISIQITTLPVLLYFFYEIPTYGIFLNLLILPLVSIVVVCSMLGGILGLFLLPLAGFPLFCVTQILHFYETLCHLSLKLPEPVQILGRPSFGQILVYYLILAFVLWFGYKIRLGEMSHQSLAVLCIVCAIIILQYRMPPSGLQFTMLDVGQGDGIFLQEENGRTILIDGGSSDVSNVGTYRILPYLKYYGIRKIDYLVMSHSDEDHISGQRELLEKQSGVKIGCYLMPELPPESQNENYQSMKKAVKAAGVPLYFLNTGDYIQVGRLKLNCLHPDKSFQNDSANACSVTLSLQYGLFQVLLTGDLEKEGEEIVLRRLKEGGSAGFTMLKTAHHGSKNSTSDAFLSVVNPQIALISCGKRNRYGHPHRELLERIKDIQSRVFRTDESGAVRVLSDGKSFSVHCYLKGEK
jgi:competence protein ComEC